MFPIGISSHLLVACEQSSLMYTNASSQLVIKAFYNVKKRTYYMSAWFLRLASFPTCENSLVFVFVET